MNDVSAKLQELKSNLKGELLLDNLHKILYATDASAYREIPFGVAYPKDKEDVRFIINFTSEYSIPIIPRAAGTSLAGQVVGEGLIVDCSKYMNQILDINVKEKWIEVEPGVVLDELNLYLKKYNLFFSPETSTSSRCTLGGMLGNNSCGSHSIIYGSTRDHILSTDVILSDGSDATFTYLNKDDFYKKLSQENFEGRIYQKVNQIISNEENRNEIIKEYPHSEIRRRNNGYALDELINCDLFNDTSKHFNFSKLLAGSEGTLAFTTKLRLNLVPLPPKNIGALVAHFNSVQETFEANLIALKYKPGAVEIIDDNILECTKSNKAQFENRSFIEGDPSAILVIEFARDDEEEIYKIAADLKKEFVDLGYGYHYPLLMNDELNKVWSLRKAGLGLLSNIKDDKKAEPFIEDVAVRPTDIPSYMKELHQLLNKYNLECVHYAHIGSGEMHIRPKINLKDKGDVFLFHEITKQVAQIVKKYRGSLSGEHGDGRLRGEFIPIIIGDKNYQLCKEIKSIWDPKNIFNPGKIVDTPKMNDNLRYLTKAQDEIKTIQDFSSVGGILKAAEKCNGSGDCRNSELIAGTMCPSYKATKEEKHTTRARANALREFLTRSEKINKFDHQELYEVMELCVSCKACKSECPSSVDMAKLKAEFLQHYYDKNGVPLRSRVVAYFALLSKISSLLPSISNYMMRLNFTKIILNLSLKRNLPSLYKFTFKKWYSKNASKYSGSGIKKVHLFNDEFTNYNDVEIGITTFKLLSALGYEVKIPKHIESGRTFISKGLLRKAKVVANKNIELLKDLINTESPLIGIEPSAILSFRDEYLDLAENKIDAEKIAANTFTIDEFLLSEIKKGNISKDQFSKEKNKLKVHCHCQQKAIASSAATIELLSFPENYNAEEIPSGCCGMAGSFGYEKEHYDVSMKIGNLVLFPAINNSDQNTIISAAGTSCRHQIKDGTERNALHTVEILYDALVDKNEK